MRRVGLLLTALALLPVLVYAGLTVAFRTDAIGFGTVFGQLGWLVPALGIGGVLSLIAAGLLLYRRAIFPGLVSVTVAAIAFGMVAGPAAMKAKAGEVPFIHDVSTDTDYPPAFVAILPLRADAPNPPEYDPEQAAPQRAYYTDLKTTLIDRPYPEAFEAVLEAMEDEGLDIVAAVPSEGRIEGVATTRWFGFKDDVVVRLGDAHGVATVIDIRSKSRVGGSDLGVNAARIRSILARVDEAQQGGGPAEGSPGGD